MPAAGRAIAAAAACSSCARDRMLGRGPRRCSSPRRARCCSSRRGSLAEQVDPPASGPTAAARRRAPVARRAAAAGRDAVAARRSWSSSTASAASPTDGREYVTILGPGQCDAGAVDQRDRQSRRSASRSSESGCGYTWSGNSRENQLTPWSNDPVSDPPGEAIYVRDEETGELWGPTALPIRERDSHLRRPPRPGLQPLRARRARHRARARAVRAARRSDQDLAADDRRTVRPRRGGCRSPRMSNGCSAPSRSGVGAVRRHRDRSRDRRAVRAQSVERRVRRARRVRRPRRPADGVDRRPDASSSAATARSTSPAALDRGAPLSGRRRRRPGSLRARCRRASSCRPDGATEVVVLPRRGGDADAGARR